MGTLESVEINRSSVTNDFRFPVQYVNRPNGDVSVGDKIVALPSGKSSTVKEIVTYDGNLERAVAGQAVTLTLNDEMPLWFGWQINRW